MSRSLIGNRRIIAKVFVTVR
ncbi:hypothetical protein ACTIVE_3188 [Actinomadura verrucosospora]|uniref:Uncharacterized protein n=1 Tax=Actinomadura verrucosospora TaxID=46165 RepID=A0A7D3VSK9_ACTVE|nr:hypothetical protein ACTIVE_3188 [Actinomadura verrucosospora]